MKGLQIVLKYNLFCLKVNIMLRLLEEEEGQGMTEYALIISLIAVVLIGTLVAFKEKVITIYEGIMNNTNV